jgi:hypothetical protein
MGKTGIPNACFSVFWIITRNLYCSRFLFDGSHCNSEPGGRFYIISLWVDFYSSSFINVMIGLREKSEEDDESMDRHRYNLK